MTFEEFQATATQMTAAEYEAEFGDCGMAELLEPGDTLLSYHHGSWIVNRADGSHFLMLETNEWITAPGGPTLADLERHLWDWLQPNVANENATAPKTDDETRIARVDVLARAMMATRPDLKEMSLDEWLAEHFDRLTEKERNAATAIIELHYAHDD